jgi:TPR repeat protein
MVVYCVNACVWQSGVPFAHNALGILYQQGLGVPRNVTRAIEHLTLAVEQGVFEAHATLGACYSDSTEDSPVNLTAAKHHFSQGAQYGDGKQLLATRNNAAA